MTGNKKKQIIVLDLDNTLICSEAINEDYDPKDKKFIKKAEDFDKIEMDSYYMVFYRPYLQEFLTFLFDNFTVSIWTAASKDYALFIIENIIIANYKNRKIDWIFFSYHCDISKTLKNGTKDLSIIWDLYKLPGYSKYNTIIIDDYSEVYETQPNNCFLIEPFNFKDNNSHKDKHLLTLQDGLAKLLENKKKTNSPAEELRKHIKATTKKR
jgi:TFIIF-interacting CTD phosphatase-like protein